MTNDQRPTINDQNPRSSFVFGRLHPRHWSLIQRLWWNLAYLLGKTPWDTGLTPPEVRAVVESGRVQPGRALDLGCGTGTNVIYLAQHGFEVVGVDISSRAIAWARRKIEQAKLTHQARVYAGDVTRLDTLSITGPFDLAIDIGCLHAVDLSVRPRYAEGLISRIQPGGLYMLYAFGPGSGMGSGLSPEETKSLFTPAFTLLDLAHGQDRAGGGVGSAWYTFQKT